MCTALTLKTNDFYFGRNLDLDRDFGQKVVITPRNYELTFKKENTMSNHYAFIGMAVVVANYPLYAEAVNEKGLGVAGLNFPAFAKFNSEVKNDGINITPYEIISYILAKYDSVSSLKKDISKFNLVAIDFMPGMPVAPLHFIVSDKNESIVIENTENGLNVTDNPTGVMTNSPMFSYHLLSLNNYLGLSPNTPSNSFSSNLNLKTFGVGYGSYGLPGDYSPNSRFIKATFMKENSVCEPDEKSSVAQFFHILDSVKFVKGSVRPTDSTFEKTTYSSCVNTVTGDYYYKTYDNPNISKVSMSKVDLDAKDLYTYELQKELVFSEQN